MSLPLTTPTTTAERSSTKFYVNRGEQLVVTITTTASDSVDWTGSTCTGQIRTDAGGLLYTFATENVTLDGSGNGTFQMVAEGTTTDDWGVGTYWVNFAITAGASGPFHTLTHPVVVCSAPVQ